MQRIYNVGQYVCIVTIFVFAVNGCATIFQGSSDKINVRSEIEGTWIPVSGELGGRPFPEKVLRTMKLILTDTSYTAMVGGALDIGTLALYSSYQPGAMDIVGTEGPNKGRTILSIYEVLGDTLRICYDLAGKTRPTQFTTKPNTQLFLVSYSRAKL
jgi:uncharacterized protein (TIGR03067 family)